MKTSELIKIIISNDFDVECIGDDVFIKKNESVFGLANTKENTMYVEKDLPKSIAKALFDYAYTPLEEREEEKKYYLRLKISGEHIDDIYLNLNFDTYRYVIYDNEQSSWRKNVFTQKEIDAMPFDTKFFEKVEVE